MERDYQLHQLAAYDVTKGFILICRTADEELKLRKEIVQRFNYFKKAIQQGEYSLLQLKDHVLSRFGPYRQISQTTDEEIAQLKEDSYNPTPADVFEEDRDERDDHKSMNLMDSLASMLPPLTESLEFGGKGSTALKEIDDMLKMLGVAPNPNKSKRPIGDPFGVLNHEEDRTKDKDLEEDKDEDDKRPPFISPEEWNNILEEPPEELSEEPPEDEPWEDLDVKDDNDDDDLPF